MKKWGVGVFLLLFSSFQTLTAEDSYFPVGNFIGGLNSFYSSLFIPENEVQEALNVYFDKDYAVTKREGYTLYGTTTSVRFYNSIAFTDSTNENWLIAISTEGIFASPGTGVFTVKIATVPAFNTSIVSAVNAFGRVYFVDNVQGVYYWDGASTVYVGTSSPKGTLITEFHGRLWVSGLSIPNQNQLYASEFLNGSNWTTGSLVTSPVVLTVGLNDNYDGISALFPGYNDTLYVFKRLSINGVYGFDQSDFEVRTLTKDAGCIDQGSVQPFRSNLVFMSQRGVELFDGFRVQLISKKIHDKVEPATQSSFNQRAWLLQTAADWESGVFNSTSSAINDTENLLRIRYPDNFSVYRDSNTAFTVWETYFSGGTPATGTITSSSNRLNLRHDGGTIGNIQARTVEILPNFAQGTTYHIRIDDIPFDATNTSSFFIALATAQFTQPGGPIVTATTRDWYVSIKSTESGKGFVGSHANGFSLTSLSTTTQSFTFPFTFDFFISTSNFRYTINDSNVILESTHTWPSNQVYVYLGQQNFGSSSKIVQVDDFQVAPLQMSFMSPTFNIGTNITSWGAFNASQDLGNGGTITYEFCSDNNSSMTTPDCQVQAANSQILVGTDSYARWSATFTITSIGQDPILYSGLAQWNEGGRRPRMASIYHDDRYFLSITTNTLSDGNDATLVLAQGLNGQLVWSMFDINSGTWVLYKNQVYHGDSNVVGKFYLDNQGFNDNGAAINAYVRTKDFAIENILAEKIYNNFVINAEGLGNYSINTSYFLDKEDTEYSLSMSTQNENGNFLNQSLPFPLDGSHQVFSKVINFKFGNSQVDAPMQLYGGFLAYRRRPIIQ